MDINKTVEDKKVVLALVGRLDTTTAPELEAALKEVYDGCDELVFDFKDLEYISSAGLRVLLASQKTMNGKSGSMVVNGANDEIKEVFDITGFSDILTIN